MLFEKQNVTSETVLHCVIIYKNDLRDMVLKTTQRRAEECLLQSSRHVCIYIMQQSVCMIRLSSHLLVNNDL